MKLSRYNTIKERFWDRIIKTDTCWLWGGAKDHKGYGIIRHSAQQMRTHRLMWILTNGKFSPELYVLHSCDNPSCVNPKHLFLGTHKENMKDKADKGRAGWKLSCWQVRQIKRRYASGETQRSIAKEFGVDQSHISYIVTNKIWPADRDREEVKEEVAHESISNSGVTAGLRVY